MTVTTGHEFCLNPLHPGPCAGWKQAKKLGLDHTMAHPDLVPKRRRRPRREPEKTVRARMRQSSIDQSRGIADVLAELEERALLNEEDNPNVLQRAIDQTAQRGGVRDHPLIDELIDTAGWGDPRDLRHAIRRAQAHENLERIGGLTGRPVQRVAFNPKEHESIGARPRVGERVNLVRPGYYGTINGEKVLLSKAKVEEADDLPASETGDSVDWEARIASGVKSRRNLSNSDNYSKVELLTFNDGSKAVLKTGKVWPGDNWPMSMVDEHDAEELGAEVAREMGLNPPGIYRASPDEAYFDYIEDDVAELGLDRIGWGQPVPPAYVNSSYGRRMGLLDVITENRDRNDGNWFAANEPDPDGEDELTPIDHGLAWQAPSSSDPGEVEPTSNPFAGHYVNGELGQWKTNDLHPAYVVALADALSALKPRFERLGRGRWHGRMMQRLRIVQQNAKGTRFL